MKLHNISVHRGLSLVAVALLTGLFLPAVTTAIVQEVAVVPSQPSRCDSVVFHAAGYFPDGCWH